MNQLIAVARQGWELLINPPAAITDSEQRRKSRLLLASLVILIPGGLFIGSFVFLGIPGSESNFLVIAAGMLLLAPAYALGRNGHYTVAAVMAVTITQLTCFGVAIANPDDPWPYAYLVVGTFLARLFFESLGIVVATISGLVGIALLAQTGVVIPGGNPAAAPLFLLVAAMLLLIAQRHRAELEQDRNAALRASESLLRQSQQIAHIGSWEWDLTSSRVRWSEEMHRIYGIAPGAFRGTLDDAVRPVHPDDLPAVQALVADILQNNAPRPIEYRVIRPDGTTRMLWGKGELVRDSSGVPTRVIGTVLDITERKQAETQLLENAFELARILDNLQDTYYRADSDGRLIRVSASIRKLLGYDPAEMIGRPMAALYLHPDGRAQFLKALAAAGGDLRDYEAALRHKNGSAVWVSTHSRDLYDEQGQRIGIEGVVRDVTETKAAHEQMRKLSSALEQSADIVMITNAEGVIDYVNPQFERSTGYSRAEAVGGTGRLLKSGRQGPAFYRTLWETVQSGQPFSEVFVNRRKDGTLYFEEKTISPLKDSQGRITHYISTGKDVSERIQVQERLQHMAQHDALTELPNRVLLLDRLRQALARARWRRRLVAVLFVDLDRFKTINDSLGHEVGDQVLQRVADRLNRSVRDGDTVARFGGDEFVVLLDDVANDDDIRGVAQKVLDAVVPPLEVAGRQLYLTASLGVSLYPNDGEDSSTLLKNADIAMYRAKESGKNTYRFFSPDMSVRALERLALESSLRRALEHGEFVLHYQPQMDAVSGELIGVEALLRWQHPDLGLVLPSDFVPVLEETDLILPTGAWVLNAAWDQLAAWRAEGWPSFRLAVNLSPRQFEHKSFLPTLRDALDRHERQAGLLEIEITEGVLAQHTDSVRETLEAIRALGVRVAIDDFGTGYSSLSYLRRFPVDTLKIDRSFIQDIPHDADDCAIATAVTALATSLKLEMIAEGVETEAQREFLIAQGCRQMQGLLFSRPMPAAELSRWMRSTRHQRTRAAGKRVVQDERGGE